MWRVRLRERYRWRKWFSCLPRFLLYFSPSSSHISRFPHWYPLLSFGGWLWFREGIRLQQMCTMRMILFLHVWLRMCFSRSSIIKCGIAHSMKMRTVSYSSVDEGGVLVGPCIGVLLRFRSLDIFKFFLFGWWAQTSEGHLAYFYFVQFISRHLSLRGYPCTVIPVPAPNRIEVHFYDKMFT